MTKWIETTGRSEEDAIAAALFQLGLDRDDVSVEVLERAKSGFLGFGSSPARVRVSYEVPDPEEPMAAVISKPEPEKKTVVVEPVIEENIAAQPVVPVAEESVPVVSAPVVEVVEETILAAKPGRKPRKQTREPRLARNRREADKLQAEDELIIGKSEHTPVSKAPSVPVSDEDEKAKKIMDFLTGLMEHLEVETVPQIGITEDGNYKVLLQGKGLGAIIGRRGETLDAIQQLTNYSVNRGQSKRVRIHIDAEGYRAKREESLQNLARKVAGKVIKYRKNMTLEPMNAYERHVIHAALQDMPKVSTYSTGVEPNRRTVVAYTPDKK